MDKASKQHASFWEVIRTLYFSVASGIGLVVFIIGAVGAVRLFTLNVVFQVNEGYYPVSVYDQDSCKFTYSQPDNKQIPRSPEEVQKCVKELDETRKYQANQDFKRNMAESIALGVVGLPVWLIHFGIMQADWKKRKASLE